MHAFIRRLPRFRHAYREMESLSAREEWSRDELNAHQLRRVNQLWQHATAHVPHYKQLRIAHDLPAVFSSLDEYSALVPVLEKPYVRTHPKELLAQVRGLGNWRRTGGSTGEPTEVYWEKEAHLESMRGKYRWQASHGIDIFDRCAFLWGHFSSFAPGWRGRREWCQTILQDMLRNRIRLSAYDLNRSDLREHLRRIKEFRPVSIYAYASAMHLLAMEAERTGFHCPTIRAITCGGELLTASMRQTVQRAFGVPLLEEYGSTECGFMAGADASGQLRIRDDNVILESVPREDGRFDILVTVLGNKAFPLIRYDIGDTTDHPIERPSHGLSILPPVAGRNNDLLVARDGQLVYAGRVEAVFEFLEEVRLYQVHQQKDGGIHVTIELANPGDNFDNGGIRRELQELTAGYPVTVKIVDQMPLSLAGKHRFIFSDVATTESMATTEVAVCG